jgi:hypothetical protein
MSNRKLKIAVGNHYSRPKSIENGVVQGAVLSVTSFLVAMTDIVKDIKEPTQIMGYADDWVVITSNKAPVYWQRTGLKRPHAAFPSGQRKTDLKYRRKKQKRF